MARFLDNLLRLLNRLVEPSTQADDAAGALSKADALNALAESGDFRIVPHLLPFFAKGDALSRQAAQAITTLMRGLGPSEIALAGRAGAS